MEIIEKVMRQIADDIRQEDEDARIRLVELQQSDPLAWNQAPNPRAVQALEELLGFMPIKYLKGYLSEEEE